MAEKKYIDIEAAKNALCRYCRDISNWRMCERNDECNLLCRLDGVPAADVRGVKRGEWVPDYDYTEYDFDGITPLSAPKKFQDGWQCSLCGRYMPDKTNYCPNCGADMRPTSMSGANGEES